MTEDRIIGVSDLNSWLYCPRKLYLMRISKLQISPNRNMMIGKIKHSILENFSKREESFISSFEKDYDKLDLAFMYEDFLKGIANLVFVENQPIINKFMIDKEDIFKKVMRDFSEDIKLRIQSVKEITSKGIFKENICKNLDSVYISEVRLESLVRGLRGRVDRIMISRSDGSIIPFELKSREERIFHSDEIQLAAYAILLEDYYKIKVEKGFIEVGNKKQEILLDDKLKGEVIQLISEIRKIYHPNAEIPPIQSNFNKCRICEFKQECMSV